MGFKVPRKTARLQFEGDEFEGCEIVVALDLTFAAQEHFEDLQFDAKAPNEDEEEESEKAAKTRTARRKAQVVMLNYFAENCILSWNLESDDAEPLPLPISGASIYTFPSWFGMKIMNGWAQAVKKASEVDGPLEMPSPNGNSPKEPNATMEASLSHQSS